MSGFGHKRYIWSKELDDRLLKEIRKGKSWVQLSIIMNMSTGTILTRLKQLGFSGLRDVKRVLQ